MTTKAVQQGTISTKLIERWEQVGQKLSALAQEFPASKFEYKPADGVRTIAEVLRHVAFWNQYVADSVRGKKADDSSNELAKDKFSTKAQIVGALDRTTKDAAEALKEHASGMSPEIAETLISFLEHNCEHYGQLVVYARLNAITPPASRG